MWISLLQKCFSGYYNFDVFNVQYQPLSLIQFLPPPLTYIKQTRPVSLYVEQIKENEGEEERDEDIDYVNRKQKTTVKFVKDGTKKTSCNKSEMVNVVPITFCAQNRCLTARQLKTERVDTSSAHRLQAYFPLNKTK